MSKLAEIKARHEKDDPAPKGWGAVVEVVHTDRAYLLDLVARAARHIDSCGDCGECVGEMDPELFDALDGFSRSGRGPITETKS